MTAQVNPRGCGGEYAGRWQLKVANFRGEIACLTVLSKLIGRERRRNLPKFSFVQRAFCPPQVNGTPEWSRRTHARVQRRSMEYRE